MSARKQLHVAGIDKKRLLISKISTHVNVGERVMYNLYIMSGYVTVKTSGILWEEKRHSLVPVTMTALSWGGVSTLV